MGEEKARGGGVGGWSWGVGLGWGWSVSGQWAILDQKDQVLRRLEASF